MLRELPPRTATHQMTEQQQPAGGAALPSITDSAAPGVLHRLLIESVTEYAIYALDIDGNVVSWNPGAERVKGYSAEEIVGRHFSTFFQKEDVDAGKPVLELAIAREKGRFEEEGWRIRKDGRRFWANVVITPLRNASGGVIGYAKITRDLTDRRAAEQRAIELAAAEAARVEAERRSEELAELMDQLQQQTVELETQTEEAQAMSEELELANEELQQAVDHARQARLDAEVALTRAAEANRAKSEFLAMMSHELRTPLNAIMGYVDLLDLGIRGNVSELQRQDLGRVRIAAAHLLTLISALLNYAKLEAGQMHYRREAAVVADLLREIDPFVLPQVAVKGLTYLTEPCSPSLVAVVDHEKVLQVLLNLVGNAIKFTDEGKVTVAATAEGDRIAIRVTDTGPGISPQKLERIFDPFVQLDATLAKQREGIGLGLAISRDLARGMGGDVVASSDGSGSTFTLYLPAATSTA